MLEGLLEKLKGFASGKFLTKEIGGVNQGAEAPSPFDASPPDFGDAGMPDMGAPPGFGDADMPAFDGSEPPGFGGADMPGFDSPPGESAPEESGLGRENAEKIDELNSKLAKLDVTISTVQRATDEMRDTVGKLDESVLELLSMYEIVSNQVNPFVGDAGIETIKRFDKIEKRLNVFGENIAMAQNDIESASQQMATNLSEDVKPRLESMNNQFGTIAEVIDAMGGKIDELSTRTGIPEELDEIITEKIEEILADAKADTAYGTDLVPIDTVEGDFPDVSDGFARLEHLDDDPMTAVVLLNWIEFLMERVGRNNLMDALDYYVDIGWIGEGIRDEMLAYARGIDYYVEKPTWRLLTEDHTKSLIFIERLCGRRINRNMLSTTEREMSKVKHGLEELYGI